MPEPSQEPPKEQPKQGMRRSHWMNQFGKPLLASVPTLLGVMVGSLAGHFAEASHINFEREERYRQEQLERVVKLAHALNGLYSAANDVVSSSASGQRFLCGFANEFTPLQDKLMKAGVLKHKFFGDTSAHPAQEYQDALDDEVAKDGPNKADAAQLKRLLLGYSTVLNGILEKTNTYFAQRAVINNDTIFDVMVYFPEQKNDVFAIADAYDTVTNTASSETLSQDKMCSGNFAPLRNRMNATHVRSFQLTINLARSLQPDIVRDRQK